MKKILCALFLFTILLTSAGANSPSFDCGLGLSFFNYRKTFLNTGVVYLHPLSEGMEANVGITFGLVTEDTGTEILPSFFIPADIGLNFTFNKTAPIYLVGIGLSPVFLIEPAEEQNDVRFYIGPYVKGGVRIKVHKLMRWFFEIQQDLLVGKPNWINTGTRLRTGVNFSFEKE